MVLSVADRVLETSTSTGTGTINLAGAVTGFRSFISGVGTGKKVVYFMDDSTDWEVGIGIVTSGTPNTLSRTTVLASSNSNALVNWGAGTRNVRIGPAASVIASKDENLNLIVGHGGAASGTATAQTITLDPVPLDYSDGMLLAWYSQGNVTGPITVNVNGKGAKSVKWRGSDLADGAFAAGNLILGIYKASTGFVELVTAPKVSLNDVLIQPAQCRLIKNGANITLSRCNGKFIFIDGVQETIPSAGVSLPPTGLTAGTTYYIYAFMNSGVMALEASATGHSTDATTGVEIKTGDDSRTLVGMVRPVAGPAFQDTANQRFVISYFNRRHIACQLSASGGNTIAAAAGTELNAADRVEFLTWAEESIPVGYTYMATPPGGASTFLTQLTIDGAAFGLGLAQSTVPPTYYCTNSVSHPAGTLAEGYHYIGMQTWRTNFNFSFVAGYLSAQIRG